MESFKDIRFCKFMEIFGMAFLHDLDVQSCRLRDIAQDDPADLVVLCGHVIPRTEAARPLRLHPVHEPEDFPWGQSPSWQRIQDLLRTECCTFLKKWEMAPGLLDHAPFHKLFTHFTADLWLSIASHIVDANKLPRPRTLEEAMQAWTPQRIEEVLGKDRCHFLPSAHGLAGRFPKNMQRTSFADRRTIFFPGLDTIIPDNIWKPYTSKQAYLGMYHRYLITWSEGEIRNLHKFLDDVFSNLQCLPPSKPPNAPGSVIWSTTAGKILFVTNSSFYRIREVGGRQTKNALASVRPQMSRQQLQIRISEAYGVPLIAAPRARARPKSLKTRNRRQPPPNNARRPRPRNE